MRVRRVVLCTSTIVMFKNSNLKHSYVESIAIIVSIERVRTHVSVGNRQERNVVEALRKSALNRGSVGKWDFEKKKRGWRVLVPSPKATAMSSVPDLCDLTTSSTVRQRIREALESRSSYYISIIFNYIKIKILSHLPCSSLSPIFSIISAKSSMASSASSMFWFPKQAQQPLFLRR